MNHNILESVMDALSPDFVKEAHTFHRKRTIGKILTVAASFALFCAVSAPLLLTSLDVQAAYHFLYSVSPQIAQTLKPIQKSCVDNGIKMEVLSAKIKEHEAKILLSLQDLTENRIDETTDLFDSYSIHSPHDSSASCSKIGFEEKTKTATFLVTIQSKGIIEGDKITFSLHKFLSNKQEFHAPLDILISPSSLPQTKSVTLRGMSNMDWTDCYRVLDLDKAEGYSPVNGVTLLGQGIVDETLRIQVHYSDILKTDNHGTVSLVSPTGEKIRCLGSLSFWDEEHSGSFEEYLFSIPNSWEGYSLYGDFYTCSSLTQGNWQITFPLNE